MKSKRDYRRLAMTASLIVALVMLVGKMWAYQLTGSAAIFSDAMESVVHLLATLFASFSLWLSLRPADESHPYGHGKIAYFSSGFEGGLIMLAAISIIYSAVIDLIQGPVVERLGTGIVITGGLGFVNLLLGLSLVYVGRRQNSLVLVANGKHVLTDMWTSLGVVVGLLLVELTEIIWLDPVVAILVALNILWTAVSLVRKGVHGLMETTDPDLTERIVDVLQQSRQKGAILGYHQLRHRRIDNRVWVEYHLLFPDDVSVSEAHMLSHEVEDRIHELFSPERVIITAHLEPENHDDAHDGAVPEPGDALGISE
jgi:cation diffusion facilitator family transporter